MILRRISDIVENKSGLNFNIQIESSSSYSDWISIKSSPLSINSACTSLISLWGCGLNAGISWKCMIIIFNIEFQIIPPGILNNFQNYIGSSNSRITPGSLVRTFTVIMLKPKHFLRGRLLFFTTKKLIKHWHLTWWPLNENFYFK